MVRTTNRSNGASIRRWLCNKVRHPSLGGPRRLTMYLATLDCATSNPSLSSCRSAPHPVGATSNASSSKSRLCANARASRAGSIVRTF